MRTQFRYKAARFGLEVFPRGEAPARHLHFDSYASVVLSGSFVEAGFGGRVTVQPGDVLLHSRFDCHANSSRCSRSVTILSLPWRDGWAEGHFHVSDPDLLVRLAEKDPRESMSALAAGMQPAHSPSQHWTELLASKQYRLEARARSACREILRSTRTLTTIAYELGFSDLSHLSRSVRLLTGYSPSAWRSWARNSVQA
jgi:AraC-like DNA-binding protein